MQAPFEAVADTEPECDGWAACAVENGQDFIDGLIGTPGDLIESIGGAAEGVGEAVGAASDFANFWSDPMGNMFLALQDGARNLAEGLLPALTGAIMPDLTAAWFIQAYKVSFALSLFVFVLIIIPQIVRTARGQQSGRDLAESLGLYAPAFILGAMFGPAVGAFLVKFFSALSNDLIAWGIEGSTATLVTTFTGMLSENNALGFAGGAVIGALLMILMIIGLMIVLLVLIVQLITLYFSGVLFPLGFVWIVDPQKRAFGSKIAYLWLGILASHPLLFFLLGISYSMIAASTSVFTNVPTLEKTVTLVVSILALLIAGFSPLLLAKFAPVLPMGGGGQSAPSATIGSRSMQEADSRISESGSSSDRSSSRSGSLADDPSSSVSAASSGNSSGGSASGGSAGGGGSSGSSVSAGSTAAGSGSSSGGGGSDVAGSSISHATADKSSGGREMAGAGASASNSSGGTSTPNATAAGKPPVMGASTPAAAADGGPAAGGMAAAGGSTAAGGAAAAGAAETATGVGAVVGVPTMIAAGASVAVSAATQAYHKAEEGAEKTADIAGSAVDEHEEHYGKDNTHE
ncbi:MAG TPA: hypothetical protein VGP24_09070 [Glaciihabitans sp.]|nr:hypothetical protein [Glaciihabitans sp.]